jgi:hypothetical protein
MAKKPTPARKKARSTAASAASRSKSRGKSASAKRIRAAAAASTGDAGMAAPHVSGLIACFLSVRKEFIGYPERVKDILLNGCTDLKRDRMHQGAGMPNLVKMLLES